jgi:AraC family transcriptional regulator of adaptative response/methylated-DNA-[protein]-cysteine methyltransferase
MESKNHFTFQEMLTAARNNDTSCDGKFWIAVKTTRIYCLPSCKARFPLQKNITFFSTREEAIANGFRGCKKCMSEFYPNTAPNWLKDIEDHLIANPTSKISPEDLIELVKVDITTIRRYFKLYHGISPMKYHRQLRLAHAKKELETGGDLTDVSTAIGFTSIEGFIKAFQKEYGISPRRI